MDRDYLSAEAGRRRTRRSSSDSPPCWCSCSSRRCTRVGPCRSRCCSRCRLGLFGALLGGVSADYPYDIYTQIGIVTLIGLAAKNAILIVEFAKVAPKRSGEPVLDAALEAAGLRLRPILMTRSRSSSGVLPLFLAVGASAAAPEVVGHRGVRRNARRRRCSRIHRAGTVRGDRGHGGAKARSHRAGRKRSPRNETPAIHGPGFSLCAALSSFS